MQNELRKQWEVHYSVPVNIYAHEELRQKKANPLNIWQYINRGQGGKANGLFI